MEGQEIIDWHRCLAYGKYYEAGGYSEPTVIQTDPKYKNFLAGPYKITYSCAVDEGEYVGAIIDAVLKDDDGNEIPTSNWYFADRDGNRLEHTGEDADYKYPLPNEEFYLKVENFHRGKAFLTISIEKIDLEILSWKSYNIQWRSPVWVEQRFCGCGVPGGCGKPIYEGVGGGRS